MMNAQSQKQEQKKKQVQRDDSKDPARTCAGFTGAGRRCRRTVVRSDLASAGLLYCWQHKDQAPVESSKRQTSLNRQSSIETMVGRLADLDLISNPTTRPRPPPAPAKPTPRPSLCCFFSQSTDDDYYEIRRHRVKPLQAHISWQVNGPATVHQPAERLRHPLSIIPKGLSDTTTSLLATELLKPVSTNDEPGFIYVFLVTPEMSRRPAESDILSFSTNEKSIQRYASVSGRGGGAARPKLLVKVGRTSNVQRRIGQWTKQCSQNITLVRFYPAATAVPYSHRVERLVHLELAERQAARHECAFCGREHREWFEIDASEKGLRMLDRTIKRWVIYAQDKLQSS